MSKTHSRDSSRQNDARCGSKKRPWTRSARLERGEVHPETTRGVNTPDHLPSQAPGQGRDRRDRIGSARHLNRNRAYRGGGYRSRGRQLAEMGYTNVIRWMAASAAGATKAIRSPQFDAVRGFNKNWKLCKHHPPVIVITRFRTPTYTPTPEVRCTMASDNSGVRKLNQTGMIVFIVLIFFCLPLC